MRVVDADDPDVKLSELLDMVEAGEEVIIARRGRPVADVEPVGVPAQRKLGDWRGKVWMAEDFDAPHTDEHARSGRCD